MSDMRALAAIRPLRREDTHEFLDHLLRLDPENRRKRFQGAVTPAYVRGYAEQAIHPGAVLYGYFDEGRLRAVGELHPLGPAPAREAEAAFSVEGGYRGHGLGTELFRRVINGARERGIDRLVLHCLPENLAMRRLCARFDADVTIADGEATARLRTVGDAIRETRADRHPPPTEASRGEAARRRASG